LIPHRNLRHLMLAKNVIDAVSQGLFHVHAAEHVIDGIELLTGLPSGEADSKGTYLPPSVLGRAQTTLQDYRRACLEATGDQKPSRKRSH
jgi:predicted ATP-dependent protease